MTASASATLTEVWCTARARVLHFYDLALQSYFTYIDHCTTHSIASVSATLRVLRLLVKHPESLHKTIDEYLQRTNVSIWKGERERGRMNPWQISCRNCSRD